MKKLQQAMLLGLTLTALNHVTHAYAMGGDTIRGHIVSRNSGMVLDEDVGSNKVQQWTNFGSLNQIWTIFEFSDGTVDIINNQTGNCLEIYNDVAGLAPLGIEARTAQCNGLPNQRFTLEAVLVGNEGGITGSDGYRLRSVLSTQCLDVADHSKNDGARVQQWECHDALNQRWDLLNVPVAK
jgi:hypothetical protein